jgi:hypothetical protein
MESAYFNALLLIFAACCTTWAWYARRKAAMLDQQKVSPADAKAAYRRKGWFRLGVLLCCTLAFAAYLLELPRLAPILLICLAAVCQYLVWQQRTIRFFQTSHTQTGHVPPL